MRLTKLILVLLVTCHLSLVTLFANENVVIIQPIKQNTNGSNAVPVRVVDSTGADATLGGGGVGGPVTVADGADVTQGANADASVAAGAAGTISAKIRRLTTDLDAVKTSAAAIATNTTGAATAANQTTANTSLSSIATNTAAGATAANQTNGNQLTQVTKQVGAANYGNGQVTATTTAATLRAAVATRRSITIKNNDAAITVYVGAATVTAANGFALKAGESIPLDTTALIQVIAASGTPNVSYIETYD